MATISFSQQALDVFYNNLKSNLNGSYNYIRLMSGTMPSDFSSMTNLSTLEPQVLWQKNLSGQNFWSWSSGDNYVTLNTTFSTARNTGTAEWFWVFDSANSNDPLTGGSPDFQFIGSVGTVGTDLLVGSTSITSGKYYRITGLKLSLSATEYTW